MFDKSEEWQKRRSAFNHDWLQNLYLNAVRAFVNRLRATTTKEEDLQRFLNSNFLEWQAKLPEVEWLAKNIRQELSPRVLFRCTPLSHCPAQTRVWLEELVDDLWRARNPVATWTEGVLNALREANTAYERLAADTVIVDETDREDLAKRFEEFDSLCTNLSHAISILPHGPLVK